jgi:hypothetical protein
MTPPSGWKIDPNPSVAAASVRSRTDRGGCPQQTRVVFLAWICAERIDENGRSQRRPSSAMCDNV